MTNRASATRLPYLAARIGDDYADSFAACRQLLAAMFDLQTPLPEQRASYAMDLALYDYGPIKLSTAVSPAGAPWTMVRDLPVITATGVDQFLIQYYRSHSFVLIVDGIERRVAAGDICMLDLARPVTLRADQIDNLSIIVDRSLLAPLLADVGDVHGLVLHHDSEAGIALREHLEDMWQQAPGRTIAQGLDVSCSTATLLAAVFRVKSPGRAANRGELRKSQFRAICRRIDQRIADPGLGPALFVREFHVTRATLYRLFEPQGGIGRHILGRRLAGMFRDLSDPAFERERIDAIARRWGLTNHTAAGRAFRQAYGITPSECRSRARDIRLSGRIAGRSAFDVPSIMLAI